MRLKNLSILMPVVVISFFLFFAAASPVCARPGSSGSEYATFFISTEFDLDPAKTDPQMLKDSLKGKSCQFISDYITQEIVREARERFSNLHIGGVNFVAGRPDTIGRVEGHRNLTIKIILRIAGDETISFDYEMASLEDEGKVLFRQSRVLRGFEYKCDWKGLKDSEDGSDEAIHQLTKIADAVLEPTVKDLMKWIVASTSRFRVSVWDFEFVSGDSTKIQYRDLVKNAVESELSRSDAMIVIAHQFAESDTSIVKSSLNYIITGTVGYFSGKLRVDISCVKLPDGRILASRWAVVESVELRDISRAVSEIVGHITRKMESDFHATKRTLSIVGIPHPKYRSTGEPSSNDKALTQEIVRSITQKLYHLESENALKYEFNFDTSGNIIPLTDSSGLGPSTLLSDLNSDYLVVVSYQDLGKRIRLGASMYSYDADRPTAAEFSFEKDIHKIEIDTTTTEIVKELIDKLYTLGLVSEKPSLEKWEHAQPGLATIKAHGVLRHRRIGLRYGAITSRRDPELFLGRRSGTYLEGYYAFKLSPFSFGKKGGRWDGWFEMSAGLDFGGTGSLSGPTALLILMNYKLMLTQWQYSSTGLNVAIGGGLGLHSIRYSFSPEVRGYAGTEDYINTEIVPAYNLLFELGFPLWDSWGIDLLFRFSGSWDSIDPIPDADLIGDDGPTGRLQAFYLLGGFKYRF